MRSTNSAIASTVRYMRLIKCVLKLVYVVISERSSFRNIRTEFEKYQSGVYVDCEKFGVR